MKKVLTTIHTQCDMGANGTLTADDRNTILKQLQSLREQVYAEGDSDYAGRTVFTGYKTNSTLTFRTDSKDTYNMNEYLSFSEIEEKTYAFGKVGTPTAADVAAGTAPDSPDITAVHRLRLAYDRVTSITGDSISYTYKDNNGIEVTDNLPVTTYTTKDMEDLRYTIGDNEVWFNKDTGEFLMGRGVAADLNSKRAQIQVNYDKTGFRKGEIKPENYYDCTNSTDPVNPLEYTNYENGKRINQDIEYTIAANQGLVVNTQANDVFDSDIGRDVDEMTNAVQDAIKAHDTIDAIEAMMAETQYADKTSQEYLKKCLAAATKQADYADHNLQTLYKKGLTKFEGYMSDVNLALTDVGNKGERLAITKNRMSNQQAAVEALKSNNEDRELSDIVIDYTSSYTAYQASLQAAAKIERQTLLDYL